MKEEDLTSALMAYLTEQFDQVEIKKIAIFDRDGHGLSFSIVADGAEYRLNILDEAITDLDRDAVILLFNNNQVVSVMRDLAGFPVTLTASGCIFGDL